MMKFESVQSELEYISRQDDGICYPHKVVEFAKNENTHLYSRFTWDDNKAAYEYRLEQARRIIRLQLTVIETKNNSGDIKFVIRKYHSLKDDRANNIGYRLITDVMEQDELRNNLLSDALGEFKRLEEKYKQLKELNGIFQSLHTIELEFQKKRNKVKHEEATRISSVNY